jgi:inosine-uridine nucleoside N-ribohydrolase
MLNRAGVHAITRIVAVALAVGVSGLVAGDGSAAQEPAIPPAAPVTGSRPVVIDTDLGLDDVRAIFAGLAAGAIDIEGIVTCEGSASLGRAVDHVIGLLESVRCAAVPVVRGVSRPGAAPPPWRSTADALAGAPFPPPRHHGPAAELPARFYARLAAEHPGRLHVLALGPLTNLAAVMAETPATSDRLHTIWIPVKRENDGTLRAWNLTWNPAATGTVLRRARNVVLVDVSAGVGVDLEAALADAPEDAPATRWIRAVLAKTSGAKRHRFVCDELVVAAVALPSRVRIEPARYRLDHLTDERLTLTEARDGNLHLAPVPVADRAVAWLVERWKASIDRLAEGNPPDHGDHHHDAAAPDAAGPLPAGSSVEAYLRTFHGHLGPYVVIGYRLGRHALQATGSNGHFGIRATVHCKATPPQSCMADGVQLGSGCTLGKRNIALVAAEGPPFVEFVTTDGKRITLRLRPDVPARIKHRVDTEGVEAAGRHFLTAPLDTFVRSH